MALNGEDAAPAVDSPNAGVVPAVALPLAAPNIEPDADVEPNALLPNGDEDVVPPKGDVVAAPKPAALDAAPKAGVLEAPNAELLAAAKTGVLAAVLEAPNIDAADELPLLAGPRPPNGELDVVEVAPPLDDPNASPLPNGDNEAEETAALLAPNPNAPKLKESAPVAEDDADEREAPKAGTDILLVLVAALEEGLTPNDNDFTAVEAGFVSSTFSFAAAASRRAWAACAAAALGSGGASAAGLDASASALALRVFAADNWAKLGNGG